MAWVTIDRPEARNAINVAVREGLWDGVGRFNDDDAAVLVLTGSGDVAFCAGGDLKEMVAIARGPAAGLHPGLRADARGRQADDRRGQRRRVRRRVPARPDVRPVRRRRATRASRSPRSRSAAARRGRRRCPGSCRRASRWSCWSPASRSTLRAPSRSASSTGSSRCRGCKTTRRSSPRGSPRTRRCRWRRPSAPSTDRRPGHAVRGCRAHLGAGVPQRGRPRGPGGLRREACARWEGSGERRGARRARRSPRAGDRRAVRRALDGAGDGAFPGRGARPPPGWSIRDQVSHLAYFDDAAGRPYATRPALPPYRDETARLGDRYPTWSPRGTDT